MCGDKCTLVNLYQKTVGTNAILNHIAMRFKSLLGRKTSRLLCERPNFRDSKDTARNDGQYLTLKFQSTLTLVVGCSKQCWQCSLTFL